MIHFGLIPNFIRPETRGSCTISVSNMGAKNKVPLICSMRSKCLKDPPKVIPKM